MKIGQYQKNNEALISLRDKLLSFKATGWLSKDLFNKITANEELGIKTTADCHKFLYHGSVSDIGKAIALISFIENYIDDYEKKIKKVTKVKTRQKA